MLTTTAFAARPLPVRGLDFPFIFRPCGREDACHQVSTPSSIRWPKLGSGLPPLKASPTLTG